jgi:hypothetical protein
MKGRKMSYVDMYFHCTIRDVTTYEKIKIDFKKSFSKLKTLKDMIF